MPRQMRGPSITVPTFESLPDWEQMALECAMRALNAMATRPEQSFGRRVASGELCRRAEDALGDADTVEAIEAAAFPRANGELRTGARSALWADLEPRAERAGWNDAKLRERYARDYVQAINEMRELLAELAMTGGMPTRCKTPLGPPGSTPTGALISPFLLDSSVTPGVSTDSRGHARISLKMRFNSALGLVGYAGLRLSEMSVGGRVLLLCRECGIFKIVKATGGDRREFFCSAECSNGYNVAQHRTRQKARPRKGK
jgi:hypothetical protein